MVLVDTPVWSEFIRRNRPNAVVANTLEKLIEAGEASIVGPVRQEVLSSIRDPAQFARVRSELRVFRDVPLLTYDFEDAAAMYTQCRSRGIQGSHTDFLICAVAARFEASIYTLDHDFTRYSEVLGVRLYA